MLYIHWGVPQITITKARAKGLFLLQRPVIKIMTCKPAVYLDSPTKLCNEGVLLI